MHSPTTVRDEAATLIRPLALLTLLLALWTVWTVVLLFVGVFGVALLTSGVGEPPAWFGVALFSVAVLAAAVTFAMYVYSVALDDPEDSEEGLAAGVDGAVASLLETTGVIDSGRVGTGRTDPPSTAASLALLVVGLGVLGAGSTVLLFAHHPVVPLAVTLGSIAVLYGVVRSGVRPVRPVSDHVAISLFGVPGSVPLGGATLMALGTLYRFAFDVAPGISDLSIGLVASHAVLWVVSLHCLLLAHDGFRVTRR